MDIKTLIDAGLLEDKAKQILEQIEKEIKKEVEKRVEKEILKRLEEDISTEKAKLNEEIAKLNEEKAKLNEEINLIKNQSLVERELMYFGARNIKATLALIEKDLISSKKLDISIIKQKIQELKDSEETSFLFFQKENEPKLRGLTPFESNLHKKKSTKNMGYEELCAYYEEMGNI